MLGAIIGDIVGSRFEWDIIKTKDFDFFTFRCEFTDDSVMTLAIAGAILEAGDFYEYCTILKMPTHLRWEKVLWEKMLK